MHNFQTIKLTTNELFQTMVTLCIFLPSCWTHLYCYIMMNVQTNEDTKVKRTRIVKAEIIL